MWQIVINGPGYFDTVYDLPEGITALGRADENDIVLSGDLVSRRHATLIARGDMLSFEDLKSRNGSRVNGQAAKAQSLREGDKVALGENTLGIRRTAKRSVTDRSPTELENDIQSSIILSKSVSESAVLRALDNIFPLGDEDTPAPSLDSSSAKRDAPPARTQDVAYESLVVISRVAELLATADTLERFLGDSLDLLMRMTAATTGVVLVRESKGVLSPKAVRHRGKLDHGEVPISRAIVDQAFLQGEALAVADVRGDPRFSKRESVVLYSAGQVLCIPLGKHRPFAGALYLTRSTPDREGLESVLDACTAAAHLLGAGIEKFRPPEQALVRLRTALDRALPPGSSEDRASRTGAGTELERSICTVLFADLSGFSAAARRLEPKQVAEVLQAFYQVFARVVWSHEGVVDFVGDSALGLFGAGKAQKDDATRAVRAALTLRAEWQKLTFKEPCAVKVGLHTGTTLSGTIAIDRRVDYVAVGEPVNTAAWLVGLATSDQVLMTSKTLAMLGSRFLVETLGERVVSGRQKLIVYEVKGEDLHMHTHPGA